MKQAWRVTIVLDKVFMIVILIRCIILSLIYNDFNKLLRMKTKGMSIPTNLLPGNKNCDIIFCRIWKKGRCL